MKYIVATTKNQPKNSFGGRNFVKLGEVNGADITAAKKAAKKEFEAGVTVLTIAEWEFMSNRNNDSRVKGAK